MNITCASKGTRKLKHTLTRVMCQQLYHHCKACRCGVMLRSAITKCYHYCFPFDMNRETFLTNNYWCKRSNSSCDYLNWWKNSCLFTVCYFTTYLTWFFCTKISCRAMISMKNLLNSCRSEINLFIWMNLGEIQKVT